MARQRPVNVYDKILAPSADMENIRSGLNGGLDYIDIQATGNFNAPTVWSNDASLSQGANWYPCLQAFQNNFGSAQADNTFMIAGEFLYVDGLSDSNMVITLNDPNSGAGPEAPVRLAPGMLIRKRFTSITVHSVYAQNATTFSKVRLIYGAEDTFENAVNFFNSGNPLPVFIAPRNMVTTAAQIVRGTAVGPAIGTALPMVFQSNTINASMHFNDGVCVVLPPVAGCLFELISATATTAPPAAGDLNTSTGTGFVTGDQPMQILAMGYCPTAAITIIPFSKDVDTFGRDSLALANPAPLWIRFTANSGLVSTAIPIVSFRANRRT